MSEEIEQVKDKVKTKMQSRKFIVWIVWTVVFIGIMVQGYIKPTGTLQEKALEFYFLSRLHI